MRVAIVGAGYVGLTTAACLAELGHEVTCIDVDPERVALVENGRAPFHEPGLPELLGSGRASGRLRATTHLGDAVRKADVTMIAVGTPEGAEGIDLSFVERAAAEIGEALRDADGYRVVAVKSTVVPGTTDSVVRRAVEESSGLTAGEFGLCMNPEFLREGSAVADFMEPDRIVIGCFDERSGEVLARLYERFECPIVQTTLRNAELTKYASNALLATLISFSNEIAELCEATPGTDVREVLSVLHLDRRLSPVVDGMRIEPGILSFIWAGCGFGGSCLPKDVNAIRSYARAHGVEPALLDAVAEINAARPAVLADLAEHELGSLDGAEIAVLGLAFKSGTDDVRASPALAVVDALVARGAHVRGYDPLVGSLDGIVVRSTPEDVLAAADAAVLVTPPPGVAGWDWHALCASMRRPVVIDGRGVLGDVDWPESARYLSVGRVNE